MNGMLDKKTGVALVCYCRQAERSIDLFLTSPGQWPDFIAYYDDAKRSAITELVGLLKRAGAVHDESIHRNSLIENIFLAILWSLIGPWVNKSRRSWSFSRKQLSFICTALERLLAILPLPEPPKNEVLVNLRMDFYMCQYIIERKMLGVRELIDAAKIEHFNHSEQLEHVTLEQMGVDSVVKLS